MPITADHFRWSTPREVSGDYSDAKPFRVTRLSLSCHSFTHVDSRAHMLPDGRTIDQTDLSDVAGTAFVANLRDVTPNEALDARRIDAALEGYGSEGIILLSTAWDTQRSWKSPAYWRDSPYITRDGAEALARHSPRAVAFDFPQDYTIRQSLDGIVPPIGEHVTHDVLLRRGVTLIEYLVGTAALEGPRTFLCAIPIKVEGADGAPARVVAFEGRQFTGATAEHLVTASPSS
ncbi:cyclase family protein [Pseudoruegeria sp. SK021]|uniref:cyclase family protein n=1 Tax=Pseudoruegeria sp. SK021 TaxID=1933035 RepID=UPI001F0A07E1|nr:cyclase family protein [Pseudoruegeria sp. SK021]